LDSIKFVAITKILSIIAPKAPKWNSQEAAWGGLIAVLRLLVPVFLRKRGKQVVFNEEV
jgi:hypothetical protein